MNFTVVVKTVPGGTEEINLNEPTTVENCIRKAQVDHPDRWSPRINGESADLSKVIDSDCTIYLIRKEGIKGNL
ncbi:MAG: hypothetical protein J5I47_08935 [Vicingus serpentipes]|nr:hypothetical protein [Vicingus serpentipes]